MPTDPRERDAMRRAIALSAHGSGTTSPNPPVGCVILDAAGVIVGEGYHERKGEPHAEVHALTAAGDRAAGGTAVVTLEPCNHIGRTPACRQALIDADVARVVIAVLDPTSRGEGGAARLRQAGIEVDIGLLAEEALLVLGDWLTALRRRRPVLTWAYRLGEVGAAALDTADLAALRPRFDVVLDLPGGVEEGVPGSHGSGMIDLTGVLSPYEPGRTLAALYAGGARTVLLTGDPALARPFLDRQAVDHVWLSCALSTGTAPRTSPPWALLPPGFRLTEVIHVPGAVHIQGTA